MLHTSVIIIYTNLASCLINTASDIVLILGVLMLLIISTPQNDYYIGKTSFGVVFTTEFFLQQPFLEMCLTYITYNTGYLAKLSIYRIRAQ